MNYRKRLIPVKFGEWISLGENIDGEEIKTKTKPYSVTLLQEYTNSHKIRYSSTDIDLVTELERMTYTKTPTGEIVYRTLTPKGGKRGEDHNTAALLCATIAYFYLIDGRLLMGRKQPLFWSKWIRT
jgi:hypothetical protein